MYYGNEKHDVGKIVKVGPNTKGTGRRGVPVGVALLGKTREYPAVSDPQGTKPSNGAGDKVLRDVTKRGKVKNYNKFE